MMADTSYAHLPIFITPPGETDVLLIVVAIFMIALVLIVGNLYFQLHALPERMSHQANKLQFEIVAVLGLISLFTHNHLFWIAGLILAMITIPDFTTPLNSISNSLRRISGQYQPLEPDEAGSVDDGGTESHSSDHAPAEKHAAKH